MANETSPSHAFDGKDVVEMNSLHRVNELGIVELIKNGFEIYRKLIWSIMQIIVFIIIPISIIETLLDSLVQNQWLSIIYSFPITFLRAVGILSVVLIVAKYINNDNYELKGVLFEVLKKWKTIIITGICLTLVLGLLFVLLIIPGVIALVYCTFVHQSIILRNRSGFDAMEYSKNLVSGHWWKVFFITLILYVPEIGVYKILSSFNEGMLMGALNQGIQSFINYYGITVLTLFFLNLDSIKETKEVTKSEEL